MTKLSDSWLFPAEVRGWLTETEGRVLALAAMGKVVLEIGAYCGRSTICMAQTAERVYSLDWHRGDNYVGQSWTLPEYAENLNRYAVAHRVCPLVGTTAQLTPVLGSEWADLVFIDGGHDDDAIRIDLELACRVLKPEGLLAMHDFDEPNPRRVAQALLGDICGEVHGSVMILQPCCNRPTS